MLTLTSDTNKLVMYQIWTQNSPQKKSLKIHVTVKKWMPVRKQMTECWYIPYENSVKNYHQIVTCIGREQWRTVALKKGPRLHGVMALSFTSKFVIKLPWN